MPIWKYAKTPHKEVSIDDLEQGREAIACALIVARKLHTSQEIPAVN